MAGLQKTRTIGKGNSSKYIPREGGGGRGGGSTDTEESNRSNDEVDLQAGSITGTDQSDNEATRARTNKRGKKFLVLVEPYMLVYFGIVCYVW